MHRTVPGAAGAGQSTSGSLAMVNGGDKMSEKLAALEDLNELLEEPVEEQVRINLLLHTVTVHSVRKTKSFLRFKYFSKRPKINNFWKLSPQKFEKFHNFTIFTSP